MNTRSKETTGRRGVPWATQTEREEALMRNVRAHKVIWKTPNVSNNDKSSNTPARRCLAWNTVSARCGQTVELCKTQFQRIRSKAVYRIKTAIKQSNASSWTEVSEFMNTNGRINRWPLWKAIPWLIQALCTEIFNNKSARFASVPPPPPLLSALNLNVVGSQSFGERNNSQSSSPQLIIDEAELPPDGFIEEVISATSINTKAKTRSRSRKGQQQQSNGNVPKTPVKPKASERSSKRASRPEHTFHITSSVISSRESTKDLKTLMDIKREGEESGFVHSGPPVEINYENIYGGRPGPSIPTHGAPFPVGHQQSFAEGGEHNACELDPGFRCGVRESMIYLLQRMYITNMGSLPAAVAGEFLVNLQTQLNSFQRQLQQQQRQFYYQFQQNPYVP